MAKLITPPINTTGFYKVYQPFILSADLTYRCDAIRSFTELAKRNIDVFKTYYQPHGISETEFGNDVSRKASIVTLVSSEGEFVYVPNSYIEAYPGMEGVAYQRTVLMVELGPLPATIELEYMLPRVNDLVTKATGTSATARYVAVPLESPITHDQHHQLEDARRGALASFQPLEEQLLTLTARNDELTRLVDELMEIIAAATESDSY